MSHSSLSSFFPTQPQVLPLAAPGLSSPSGVHLPTWYQDAPEGLHFHSLNGVLEWGVGRGYQQLVSSRLGPGSGDGEDRGGIRGMLAPMFQATGQSPALLEGTLP